MNLISRTLLVLVAVTAVVVNSFFAISTATAAVSTPSSTYALTSSTRTIGQSSMISGFSGSVRVTVTSSNTAGLLSLFSVSGLTTVAGYDNSSSITTAGDRIAFEATVANANTALAALQYRGTAVQTDTISVSVESAGYSSRVVNEVCETGGAVVPCYHYYKAVSSTLTWPQAYTETTTTAQTVGSASKMGWLVTITSLDEKNFVNSYVNVDSWIGAHDSNIYGSSEGNWRWVSNSEPGVAGQIFWIGVSSGTLQSGFYQNWASGEPNDYGSGEDFGQAYATGGWNDLPDVITQAAYIWETTSTTNLLGSDQVSFSVPVYSGPANTAAPVVTGSGVIGQLLTTADGTWSDNGQAISGSAYKWQRNTGSGWVDIASATSTTYTLTSSDVGAIVRSVVSKTNSAGTSSANSLSTETILPLAPGDPSLTGVTAGNGQLSVAFSAPSSNGGGAITGYHYSVDGGSTWVTNANITTGPFTISGLLNGTMYTIALRAVNAAGYGISSGTIAGTPYSSPLNTVIPSISGTPRIGGTISMDPGTWSTNGSAFTASAQQWQRNSGSGWTNISGQTGTTLAVTSADLGAQLRITISRTNAAGTTVAYSSATSAVAITAPDQPTISNLVTGGSQLSFTAIPGAVDGGAAVTLEYSLDGNTWVSLTANAQNSYTISGLNNGASYTISLRATNSAGSTNAAATLTGSPVAPVAPVVISNPASRQPGQSLSAPAPTAPEPTRQVVLSYGTPLPQELKALISSPVILTPSSAKDLSSNSGSTKEIVLDQSGRPELKPLQSIALVDGKPVDVTLVPNAQGDGYILSGQGFDITVSTGNGTLDSNASLQLTMGRTVTLEVTGFAPGQPIYLWLFSDPTEMGYVTADKNGNFSGTVPVPGGLPIGSHTMQVNGVSADGSVRSVALGVTLNKDSVNSTGNFNLLLWTILFIAVAIFVTVFVVFASRRKRKFFKS